MARLLCQEPPQLVLMLPARRKKMKTPVLFTLLLVTVLMRQSHCSVPAVYGPVGIWTDFVYACIRGNNNWSGYALTMEGCQQLCEQQVAFRCLSVDFAPSSGTCLLSRYNRNSVPPTDDFTQPCYITGYQYSERTDLDFPWTETVYGCIRLNNHGEHTVSSMEECQLLCERESEFPCLSVDFRPSDGRCLHSRYNRESIRPLKDYTQPCYVDGFQYAERVDKKYFWTDTALACIRGNNDHRIEYINSLEDCKDLCIKETSFSCLSVDYFPYVTEKVCLLSSFNRNSVQPSSDFTQPCYSGHGIYAERVNIGQWIPDIPDSCITGFNEWTGDTEDFETCKILCSQRSNCCSVDYNTDTKRCLLSSDTRATVSSAHFISPCNGFSYSERVDVRCVT